MKDTLVTNYIRHSIIIVCLARVPFILARDNNHEKEANEGAKKSGARKQVNQVRRMICGCCARKDHEDDDEEEEEGKTTEKTSQLLNHFTQIRCMIQAEKL